MREFAVQIGQSQRQYIARRHLAPIPQALAEVDQRIADDINNFTEQTMTLFFGLVNAVSTLLSFAVVLWGTGVFNSLVPDRTIRQQETARITAPISAATRVNDFFRSAGDSISAAITNSLPRADAAPADAK